MQTQAQTKIIKEFFPNILTYTVLGKIHFKVAPKDI